MEQAKYDVFISYSRKDYIKNGNIIPENIISRILQLFDSNKISYWFDKDGIYSGDQFLEVISDAIEASKMLVFVSSTHSNDSIWTAGELMEAIDSGKTIIPFRIDKSNYNKRFRMLIRTLDYIDYCENKEDAMQLLLRSVLKSKGDFENKLREKEKQQREQEEENFRKQTQVEIHNLSLDYQKLELEQEKIWNSLTEKCKVVRIAGKRCPVCNSQCLISTPYCQTCGWQFSKLFGITIGLNSVDKTLLEIARSHWHSINNAEKLKNELSLCQEEITRLNSIHDKLKTDSRKPQNKNNVSPNESIDKRRTIIKCLLTNMIHVEGGEFNMGASRKQEGVTYASEFPQHKVKISSFKIGKFPVTQEEWMAIMGQNPSKFKGNRNPVESVSWNDCQEFIKRLNKVTNRKFRLPTEAEWEFAARGGIKSKNYTYSGSNNADTVCWHKDISGNSTVEVGLKVPNELGIHDMCGNVCEWCQDYFGNYHSWRDTNPKGPTLGKEKVFRGGCWNDDKKRCRVSIRFTAKPSDKGMGLGFRLALSE